MTTKAVTIITIICATIITAQPSNDDCDNATQITMFPHMETADTTLATFDGTCSLGSSSGGNVWYAVNTGVFGRLTVDTEGCSFDTILRVFYNCGSTCFAYDDDGGAGLCSSIDVILQPTDTVYIAVAGYSQSTGQTPVNFMFTEPPSNDNCANAIPITSFPHMETADTTHATFDGTCSLGSSSGGNVWYSISGVNGVFQVDTIGCLFDTRIRLFDSCSSTCFDDNDDIIPGFCSLIKFCVTSTDTVYIAIGGFGSNTGQTPVNFIYLSDLPTNDDACDAEVVTIGQTIISSSNCLTAQPGEISPGSGTGPSSCNSQDGWCSFETGVQNSMWFQVSAYILEIEASGFDSQLAVYETTDCNDFSIYKEIAANDDGGPGFSARIEPIISCGLAKTYLVQFDGFSGFDGLFSLQFKGQTDIDFFSVKIISDDPNQCWIRDLDDPMLLTAIVNGSGTVTNYTYQWISTTGMTVDTGINNTLTIQPNITTTYSIITTDSNNCTTINNITITSIDDLSVIFEDNCTTHLINTGSDTPVTINGIISGGSGQFEYEWHHIPTDISATIVDNTLITSPLTTTKYNVTVRDTVCGIEAHSGIFIIHVENISCTTRSSSSSSSSSSEQMQTPNGMIFCKDPSKTCAKPQCIPNDRIAKYKSRNPLSVQGPCVNACVGQMLCVSEESVSEESVSEESVFSSQKQLNREEKEEEKEIPLVDNNNVIQVNVDLSHFLNIILYGMLVCIVLCCTMQFAQKFRS